MVKILVQASDRGPGFATLTISNWRGGKPPTSMCIQRNQDQKFLGSGGSWSSTPVWHDIAPMSKKSDTLSATVGPSFVDPLLSSPNAAYLARTRAEDGAEEASGVVFMGQVLSSRAMGTQDRPSEWGDGFFDMSEPVSEPEPPPVEEPEVVDPVEVPEPPPVQPPIVTKEKKESKRPLFLILAAIGAALIIGILLWFLFGRTPATSPAPEEDTNKVVTETEEDTGDEVDAVEPESAASASDACDIGSLKPNQQTQFLQGCLATSPDAAKIIRTYEAAEKAGECDMGRRLMIFVSQKGDAEVASDFAHRMDPDFHKASACQPAPDAESAAYWYEIPAAAGDVEAQRQLGKLITARGSSDFEYDRGVDFLQQAADAGDTEAGNLLQALESE